MKIQHAWSYVVVPTKLAAKGVTLKYIAPLIKEGKTIDKFDHKKAKTLYDIWSTTTVLNLFGQTPTIGA